MDLSNLSPEEQAEAERMARIAARAEARAAARLQEQQQKAVVVKFKSKREREETSTQKDKEPVTVAPTTTKKRNNNNNNNNNNNKREHEDTKIGFAGASSHQQQEQERKRKQQKKTFKFDWDASEDTANVDDVQQFDVTGKLFGNKKDDVMQATNKQQQKHWTKKSLEEMTERDWRIVRETFEIHVKGKRLVNPVRNWDEIYGLRTVLRENIAEAGFAKPTPIQMQGIPFGLAHRDVIGVAETGSGKTLAFLIPLLTYILNQPLQRFSACAEEGPLAMVMAPTRELVQQIGFEANVFAKNTGIRVAIITGGNSIQDQVNELLQGCQVIVATPGRLIDCVDNRYVVFNQCGYLVLDEADKMIEMGFKPQIEKVMKQMHCKEKSSTDETLAREQERKGAAGDEIIRVTTMFTATMSSEVQKLAEEYLKFPAIVRVGDDDSGKNRNIVQNVLYLRHPAAKRTALVGLLEEYPPGDDYKTIIFVNTKVDCDAVLHMVSSYARCCVLHGGKQQSQREASLQGFKDGTYQVLIATDVAGRGLDVTDVQHVINYEMPTEIERYSHRIGRTGRAGRTGLSHTLITEKDEPIFPDLIKYLKSTKAKLPKQLIDFDRKTQLRNIET